MVTWLGFRARVSGATAHLVQNAVQLEMQHSKRYCSRVNGRTNGRTNLTSLTLRLQDK